MLNSFGKFYLLFRTCTAGVWKHKTKLRLGHSGTLIIFFYLFSSVYGKSLNANVSAINSSSLYVNWEYAEDAPQYGFFQGYQVLFRKGNNSEGFLLGAEIDGNSTQAWLPAEECELYSFKVRAFSLEGYGKLSEAVTMETSCIGEKNL